MAGYRLSRALVLEAPETLPDGAGGFSLAWVTLGTLWFELREGGGRERAREAGERAEQIYRAYTHAAPAGDARRPRPGQRLREGERLFRILSVGEADVAGRWLLCRLREEVAA